MIHAFLVTLGVLAAIYLLPFIPAILRSGWFWKLILLIIAAYTLLFGLGFFLTWQGDQARLREAKYEHTHPPAVIPQPTPRRFPGQFYVDKSRWIDVCPLPEN
jgi:hypothetical protein